MTRYRYNIKLTNETMKIDTKKLRTYDEDGFTRRAACLCVRVDPESQVSCKTLLNQFKIYKIYIEY